MAEREVLRAEKDYSEQLNKELPGIIELAKDGKTGLSAALEKLLALEKQTRQSSDLPSTSRILETIVTLCRDAGDWNLMNEHVQLLAKKHAQLKLAITKMVQLVMTFIEQTPNEETKLSVIDTLRTVTEGKIFVEVERARVTRELSNIKKRKGDVAGAKAVLCELQVETFGSMDRKEKTAFILEQIGLCIEDNDYTQGTILSRKISTRYFGVANKEDSEIMELKLRYYEQQIQIAKHDDKYLDACKHYRAVLDTPSIEKDDSLTKQTLERIIFYVILAPYDNEQSDLLHRIHGDNRLAKLVPEQASLLKLFTVSELMPWSRIEQTYGQLLRSTDVFRIDAPKGETRWQDLRKRVIEHNVRVVAKYYTKISMDRLRQLLDLEMQETEDYLSKLVVDKTISAKIDRPAKVVTFETTRDADDVLNEWSGNMKSLLGLLERVDHLITKEEMMANIQPKAAKGKAK
ncbi:26S proteasome non-ATPase-like protein regulatory subunit 12 [Ascodesmis nigricans]|uniref:26S proteasome non-ATPase-like protein regulatory subunit 12 n=1 Tax=Ascodesmis nigricans TaxID=341454 RepID=A0A4S2N7W2_9PEZI|nr:26S proteasome non-ATPase-like protein regulatory subunit 12 [Ascodesmis nigricans]